MTMLAVKNFFLPERRAADTPRFSRMPEALMRSMRRRSLRAKRTKSLVVGQEKRKSDSFVNSQEWTMSRMVPDLRLGLMGSLCSGKSALVHRYLTGSYVQEESPEGGRFKKEVLVDGHSYLLLIRDEGGAPEAQFASWVDAVIFVFSLENEDSFNAVYAYYNKMAHLRNSTEIPLILVGTQDTISENNPRVIDDVKARKLATDLKRCSYYETCATYGLNVERVFQDACQQIVQQRLSSSTSCLTPGSSRPSTPLSLAAPPGAPAAAAPALRPQANISSLHSNSPSHNNHHSNQMNAYSKDPLMRGNHTLSASSNHIHRSNPSHNDLSSADAHSLSSANDHTRWGHALASHGSSQGLVTIATENNNIAKFTAPPCIDSLQLPSYKDSKDLPTPSSTPTTSRKTRRRSNLFTPSKKGEDKFKNEELGSGRAIPLKQGYLHKKSSKALNKEWKKKYVALCNDGRLTYHPSINDYMENVHGKEISLQYVTVKVPGQKPRGSRSVITTVPGGHQPQPLSLHTHSSALQDAIGGLSLSAYEVGRDGGGGRQEEVALPNGSSQHHTPHVTKRHRRIKSSGLKKDGDTEDQEVYEFCIVSLEGKRWRFEAGSLVERDAWVAAVERQILASLQGPGGAEAALSRHLRLVPGNSTCVDCDAPEPGWASLNLGVLMCIECSGVHRNLGSHISRVRSLELDEWPPGHLSVMLSIGNSLANSVWEADLRGNTKPGPTSPREHKERWIRKKYEGKCFLLPAVSADSECVVPVVGGGAGLLPLLQALARARPQDVNRPSGSCRRTPLLHACAQGDLPQAQLLIWNNANPNLLDADGMSCLQLARSAAAQLSSCPGAGGRGCLLGSCPQHEGAGPAGSCLCPLLALLAPPSAAHSLVQLLLSQQANTIANTLSHNGAFPAPNAKLNGNASCHQANIT